MQILFWSDIALAQFGVAKYLQNEKNFKLYIIHDVNHFEKKIFQEQKIVKFEDQWFFWDHVSIKNKIIDYKYLRDFEKKYKINIWQIAYSDPLFSKRNQYHKFSHDEILSILEQECKFFENVLEKVNPKYLIIRFTDWHRNNLLAELCKAKKIRVLMLNPTLLGYRGIISEKHTKLENEGINGIDSFTNRTLEEIHEDSKKFDRLKQSKQVVAGGGKFSKWKKMSLSLSWFFKPLDQNDMNRYDYYGSKKLTVITKRLWNYFLLKNRMKFLNKNSLKTLDDEKIIYFPLQTEPERSITTDAPFFTNQLEVITNISKSIPPGYTLYVKEHWSQIFRNWRPVSIYKKILELPNVKLIHPLVNPHKIIKKCDLAIVISSTTGLEAAFNNKPSIIFAETNYSQLSSVYRIKNIEELPQTIRLALEKKINTDDLNKFLDYMEKNSFDFDENELTNKGLEKFEHNGFAKNKKISVKDLESFLNENEKILKKISIEYLKKIDLN